MNWIDIKQQQPLAYLTGNFNGKKSDLLLIKDSYGDIFVGYMYEGYSGGEYYCDFYMKYYNDESLTCSTITHWLEID